MKAVIFDMDGVLINSEPLHNRLMLVTLHHFGIPFEEQDFVHYVGATNAYLFSKMKENYPVSASVDDMNLHQRELLIQTVSAGQLEPIPGIRDLLGQLQTRGIPAAIASSSSLKFIRLVTEKCSIQSYFSILMSGEDLPHSKPDPEIYLRTAAKLGLAPAQCLVIEDARLGVKAAKAAGMTCIGFRNPGSGNQDLSEADCTVDAIAEIDLDHFVWS